MAEKKLELVQKTLAGDRIALARLISYIEDRGPKLPQVIDQLYPHAGKAQLLGITGPPGAGKSTITDRLIEQIRAKNKSVAVIAIDPSSPFSGGAILGDRIRMQAHCGDPQVYIRSLGTRGKHGGLSQSSREVVLALDAHGFDYVLIETAGVGQTELDILNVAHGVCVVLVPESGDSIQVMKAGLMEIADFFVVNKADRPESDRLVRELITMVSMTTGNQMFAADDEAAMHHPALQSHSEKTPPSPVQPLKPQWSIPVIKTQALNNIGIDTLFAQIQKFFDFAKQQGRIIAKQQSFIETELHQITLNEFSTAIQKELANAAGQQLRSAIHQHLETPYKASQKIISSILDKKSLK